MSFHDCINVGDIQTVFPMRVDPCSVRISAFGRRLNEIIDCKLYFVSDLCCMFYGSSTLISTYTIKSLSQIVD